MLNFHILVLSLCIVSQFLQADYMVINVPVASLRTKPQEYVVGQEHDAKESRDMFGPSYDLFMAELAPSLRDPQQDTQLLYNERIICLEDLSNGFLKIEVPEQYVYDSSRQCFEHVIGYIKKEQAVPLKKQFQVNIIVSAPWATITHHNNQLLKVSMGTKLHGAAKNKNNYVIDLPDGNRGIIACTDVYRIHKICEDEETLRATIIEQAKKLVNGPYNWGGCCSYVQEQHDNVSTSCDCSGATNLAYRTAGLTIARNAHSQWLRCAKITKGSYLKPGDLIFFARTNRKDHVHHVLMYIDNDQIFESCISGGIVIKKSTERLGRPVATLSYGDTIKSVNSHGTEHTEYVIYFGSYLQDKRRTEYMRNYALGNYNVMRWVQDEHTSK